MAQEAVLIDLSTPPNQSISVKSSNQESSITQSCPCSLDLSPSSTNNPFDSIANTAEAFSEISNTYNKICSKTSFENNFERDEMDNFKDAQIKEGTIQDEYPGKEDEIFSDKYEDLMSISPPPEFYFSFDDEDDFELPALLKLSLRDSLTRSPLPESEVLNKYKQQRQRISLSLNNEKVREEVDMDESQQCKKKSILGISEEYKHLEPVPGVSNKALINQAHIPEIKLRKPCVEKSSKGPLKAMKPLQKMILNNNQGTFSKIHQDFAKPSLNKHKDELVQSSRRMSACNQKLPPALPRSKSDHTISTKEGTPKRTSLSQKFKPRSNSMDRTKFVPVASSSPCLNIRDRTPNGKMYSRSSSTPITTPTTRILKSLELKTQVQHPHFESSSKLNLQKFNDKGVSRTPPIKVVPKLKSSRNDSLCDKENNRGRNK